MANMYEQFTTDEKLETEGIWLDYGEFRVKIAHAGGANKKYLTYSEMKTRPVRQAIRTGTMHEKRSEAMLFDIYAETIILDWEILKSTNADGEPTWEQGIHKKGGGKMPFNKGNVLKTFNALPRLFFDIQQSAQSIALFRQETMEEDSKNSEASSSTN